MFLVNKLLYSIDIVNVLVSSKLFSGENNDKYFLDYLYDDSKIKSSHIILRKTSAYVKSYDGQTNWMYFLIKDDDLLEKYNTICDKVSTGIIKKELIVNLFKVKVFGNQNKTFRW